MSLRITLGLLAVALYALASHWLMVHAADRPWAVAALFGPLLLPVLALAWRRGQALLLGVCALLAMGLVWIVSQGGLGNVRRLYLAQHAGVHLALGLSFLASLRGEGEALITQMARRVHVLTPAMQAYTVRVTRLWVGYFLGMVLLSVGVYALLPWEAWSLLANVLTPLLIGVVFVGEHWARYRLHPEFDRITLAQMVQSVRHPSGGAAR
ncbi:hypothetical protein [Aquabacterium sp.]|uniref:hypothetical protein n=1 Tax=Aquabacterium sp. TaxID=1872578 RepID=UPI0037848BBB